MLDIGIIGAGVTGLTAAYDLAKAGHRVTLYEARPYIGGLASGFQDPAWEWPLERFYHHIFATDGDIIRLVEELGISDRLFFPRPTTSIYHKGRIYPMDKPLDSPALKNLPGPLGKAADLLSIILSVLAFKPLSPIDRIRFGLIGAYIRYTPFWKPLERVTADAWLTKAVGAQAYQTSWQPLLEGKFGPYYRDVNMAWFWARLSKRTSKLGYFVGGFQGFLDRLGEQVVALGGKIRLDTHVRGIHAEADGRIRLELRAGDQVHDRVLATCSPAMLRERTPTLPAEYAQGLNTLKSMGAVVMVLALKRPVTEGHYWINIPKREGFPFLAFVEHTHYIDRSHYGGDTIVYCGDYLPADHPYFELTAEALLEHFIPGIQRLNPEFDRDWVRSYWKFSELYAQPVPLLNHSANIPPLETPIANLYMANMSQVYPWDRGTNYAVEIGRRAARALLPETTVPALR